MCGIAGFAENLLGGGGSEADPRADAARERDRTNASTVRAMCAAIRHRGPDAEGIRVEPGVALGMRRLSIIDLATGQQPMHNEDETVWVVFNGEIYNYRELRAELSARGHRFATQSDKETIVHAYEEWGKEAIGRLRGMFGVALWDRRARSLLLARDRAGIKPLHYARLGDRLYFASEIKSILAAGFPRDLDPAALSHYLGFLYTPRDRSIFAGIEKLAPGHLLEWRDGRATVSRYWEIAAQETFAGSEADAAEALGTVLRDAVRCHMLSDVPLGAFLSGGVDSSVVVGLMAEVSDRPVRTFSIGFDEPAFDELEHARLVAAHFGTEHHEFVVHPDAVAILDDLVGHFDEPFGDSSAIPTWYVSEIARRHVTVVLSGDGGDELFGGYDRYLPHPRVTAFDRLRLPGRYRAAALAWPHLPHGFRGKNFLRHVAQNAGGRYLDAISMFHADEQLALIAPELRRRIQVTDARGAMASRLDRFAALPWSSRMMRLDFETYLPEDVLTKVDRMSMAHSIESRVPLLDNEVVAFAASLPASFKIREGVRKHVLKRAAGRLLPPSILARRKQGFGVPLGTWFKGNLRELFGDVLRSATTAQRGYFDRAFVDRMVGEHLSGRRDHTLRLWQLVVFELWHRQYLDRATIAVGEHAPDAVGATS
ncbi:MAG: asparagine synthase (glutamine-hydrolyzing) [Bacteroidales bacterium]